MTPTAPNKPSYQLRVWYAYESIDPKAGYTYGPFLSRGMAEECMAAIAGRPDVRSAVIEEIDTRK